MHNTTLTILKRIVHPKVKTLLSLYCLYSSTLLLSRGALKYYKLILGSY